MDLSRLAEKKIGEAVERGEFDGLRGAGTKIDLTEYFSIPAEFRVGHSLLRSNRFFPSEIEILREIDELKYALSLREPGRKADLRRLLNEKQLVLAIVLERNRSGITRR